LKLSDSWIATSEARLGRFFNVTSSQVNPIRAARIQWQLSNFVDGRQSVACWSDGIERAQKIIKKNTRPKKHQSPKRAMKTTSYNLSRRRRKQKSMNRSAQTSISECHNDEEKENGVVTSQFEHMPSFEPLPSLEKKPSKTLHPQPLRGGNLQKPNCYQCSKDRPGGSAGGFCFITVYRLFETFIGSVCVEYCNLNRTTRASR